MLRRSLRWLAVALVLILGLAYAAINLSGHDPERWHVDPATVELDGTPNEVLAAPDGATAAEPHIETQVHPERPEALLARFDAMARAQPRTQVVAGDVDSGMVTYVQRTPIVGFPDYVTAKTVSVGDGAALIVFSRSRYGQDDWGVNRQRVMTWLGELGPPPAAESAPDESPDEASDEPSDQPSDEAADQPAEPGDE